MGCLRLLRYATFALGTSWLGMHTGCSSDYSTSGAPASADAGAAAEDASVTDAATTPPPADGFTLTASPAHLTLDPGDSFPVVVSISRAKAFTSDVTIVVNGLASGVQAAPLTVLAGQTTGQFFVTAPAGPAPAMPVDASLQIVGQGGGKSSVAPLGLRLGSLLFASSTATKTDVPLTLPTFASTFVVKAWGAGGASGGASSNGGPCVAAGSFTPNAGNGGTGGAGGFATATFPAMPGAVLSIAVGNGGQGCSGGGGLSRVSSTMGPLLIAGGGGGGAMGTSINPGPIVGGWDGYAGGGAVGQSLNGLDGASGGPGTSTAGGTSPSGRVGSSMVGGAPGYPGPGAGGAGYFGGGAGTCPGTAGCGAGGGGSGYASSMATSVTLTTGSKATPPATTDAEYASGAGAGGVDVATAVAGTPGATGRVVIRLTKP